MTVPRAEVNGTTIQHGIADVNVRAVKEGPDGNVEAGEITHARAYRRMATRPVPADLLEDLPAEPDQGGCQRVHLDIEGKDDGRFRLWADER